MGKLMLPPYLAPVASVISQRNDADEAVVALRVTCTCNGEEFVVRYAGRAGDRFTTAERCGEDLELAIAAECPSCGQTHLLFDRRRHGWGPVLFPAGSQPPQSPVKSISHQNIDIFQKDRMSHGRGRVVWHCRYCGSTRHEIEIDIGWSPFAEVAEELKDRPDFNESVWIEAFETIQINLSCAGCGQETTHWVQFEVV